MIKLTIFLCFFSMGLMASEFSYLTLEQIEQSKDRNFNGIVRGMGVFQDILTRDYGAVNNRGLIKISGDYSPAELVNELFLGQGSRADWKVKVKSIILDRGYINDGTRNPRVPEKLQKVIDMYNGQIMGLVRSSATYKLLIFSLGEQDRKGWLILNKTHSEALFASSMESN